MKFPVVSCKAKPAGLHLLLMYLQVSGISRALAPGYAMLLLRKHLVCHYRPLFTVLQVDKKSIKQNQKPSVRLNSRESDSCQCPYGTLK